VGITQGRRKWRKKSFRVGTPDEFVRMIRSRKMIWKGDVARFGEKRNTYRVVVGKAEESLLMTWKT
jgi:hypothetical protein